MCHFGAFHVLWINARQTGCQRRTLIHFLLKRHYERITKVIRRPEWVSGFVICITTAQLCVQKRKRCIKAHTVVTHTINRKKRGGNNGSNFFLLLPANCSVRELITICSLSAPQNMTIYQSLASSWRHRSIHQSSRNYCLLASMVWLILQDSYWGLSLGISWV